MLEFISSYNKIKLLFLILFLVSLIIYFFKDKFFKNQLFKDDSFNEKKNVSFNKKKNQIHEIKKDFIEINNFNGHKLGYIFKNDKLGLGYYLDK